MLEPVKSFYTVPELSAATGRSVYAIRSAIVRHETWRSTLRAYETLPGPLPSEAIYAVKARGRWRIPYGAALAWAYPHEAARVKAEAIERAHAEAEILDAPEHTAPLIAEIKRLLPGAEVTTEPIAEDDLAMNDRWRYSVSLVVGGIRLLSTYGWTTGAVLPRLRDIAKIERLGRDLESLGYTRERAGLTDSRRELVVRAADGLFWLIGLPIKGDFDYHDSPEARLISEALDYGLDVAILVPEAAVGDRAMLSDILATTARGGLLGPVKEMRAERMRTLLSVEPIPEAILDDEDSF